MGEPNRKRKVQLLFRVAEKEKELIHGKMRLARMSNFEAYMRAMATKGYIVDVDFTELKYLAAELQKIDVNLKQILKYVDTLGAPYAADAAELRSKMKDCWDMVRQLFKESMQV